jgi:hypothetical protein
MASLDPRRRAADDTSFVPLVAADVQPADEAMWTHTDEQGIEQRVATRVEYVVMPPDRPEVVLVDGAGREFALALDHPVMAVRGQDWHWWLDPKV